MTSILRHQHKTFVHYRRGNRGVNHQWFSFGMQEPRQRPRGSQRCLFGHGYEVANVQNTGDILSAARITRPFTRANLERTARRDKAVRAPQGAQRTDGFGLSFEQRKQEIGVQQVTRHYFACFSGWFRFMSFAITASVCGSETSTTCKPFTYRLGVALRAGFAAGLTAAFALGFAAGLDCGNAARFMTGFYHT